MGTNVQQLIELLNSVEDKTFPVYIDIQQPIWGIVKDLSITKNSYGNNVVIINQEI